MCSGRHPKYLSGAVLWSPDQQLRIIGHVCAEKDQHFGVAGYRELQARRKREDLGNAAFEWFDNNLGRLPGLVADLRLLRENARYIQQQQHVFFRDAAALARELNISVSQQGSRLTVVQEISDDVRDAYETETRSRSRFETIVVGSLQGATFLNRPSRRRSHRIAGVLEAFDRIPPGDHETALFGLIESGPDETAINAGLLIRNIQLATRLAEECADAQLFVSQENLASLESWGRHPQVAVKFRLEPAGSQIRFVLEDRSRAVLSLSWPKAVDCSAWKGIAPAGSSLARVDSV